MVSSPIAPNALLTVEFFGSVRLRAGVTQCQVPLSPSGESLRDILRALAHHIPALTNDCLDAGGNLQPGYVVNVDGREFTRDGTHRIAPGQTLLLMTADVGG